MSLYNPSGATPLIKESGVEIRRGDYGDPASLDAAFAGADKLLIVSYPTTTYELRVQRHKSAIDAAKRAGVAHVYYTSFALAGDSVAAVMRAHIDTERYLKESGLTYTVLREGIYSESYPLYFGFFDPAEGKEEIVVPHSDGPIAWVTREDLGEGTANIMVQVGSDISFARCVLTDCGRVDLRTRYVSSADRAHSRFPRSQRRSRTHPSLAAPSASSLFPRTSTLRRT